MTIIKGIILFCQGNDRKIHPRVKAASLKEGICMKKLKIGERSSYLIIISVFLILVNVTLGVFLISLSQRALTAQIEGRMLDIANTAADMLDGDDLKKLKKEDYDTKEYQDIIKTLQGFQSNIQLQYIYCIQRVGEKEFAFSVDATKDDPGEFGDPIVYTDALYEASLGTASVDKVPYEDAWGRFYSAYSPVFDSIGGVAGIVAVDFSADWYENEVFALVRTVLIICGLSLLAGCLIGFVITERTRKRNRRLYAQLNSLADNVEDLLREVSNTIHTEHNHPLRSDTDGTGSEAGDLSRKITSMQEDLRKEIACVHRMAYIDALTSVGNTAAYLDAGKRLNQQIRSGVARFCVATFDLNGLKQINDNYGHDNGDKALVDAAGILVKVFGKGNVFRAGGDEFIVIVPDSSAEDMDRLFRQTDEVLAEENKTVKSYRLPLSISKGYAVYDKETDADLKSVFRRADEAMYQDKTDYYLHNGESPR